MKRVTYAIGALALSTAPGLAGGVERSAQSVALLFEPGRYMEFSINHVDPRVSGALGGAGSGSILDSYQSLSFGYKMALGERMDLAIVLDEPIGADTTYPGGTGYLLQGTNASINSAALTGMLRYRIDSNFSAYGGIRLQQARGRVELHLPTATYSMSTNTDRELGYLVGVAYERPDIAMRVALTYNSRITHKFDSTETIVGFGSMNTNFETSVPESLNLEFQTGVAPDTLLFGNLRWQRWTKFDISPPVYMANISAAPLVSYARNTATLNLGIGRRLNENWSVAGTVGYEHSDGHTTGNLGPVDGHKSVGVAATYTQGNMRITSGLRYMWIGGATTNIGARFSGNKAIAAGVRVGYSF